jgi:DNA-binding GntR family transcriptional regulator
MAARSKTRKPLRAAPDEGALERIAARRMPAASDGRSLAEVACDEIRRAIREGRVPTGAHLTEMELAGWLGMSRTPVREAMRRLESEGLLLNQPFRGALVMRLDVEDMQQMFAVRELLEPAAAAACALRATESEIAALREVLSREAGVLGKPAALITLNRQFHDLILEAARNQFLKKAIAAVYSLIPLLGDSNLLDEPHARAAHLQHLAILEAIEARDAARAELLARSHVSHSLKCRLARIEGDAQITRS